jgi:hypothetical protein
MGSNFSAPTPAPVSRHGDLLPSYVIRDAIVTPEIVRIVRASWEQVAGVRGGSSSTAHDSGSTPSSTYDTQKHSGVSTGGVSTANTTAQSTAILPSSDDQRDAGDGGDGVVGAAAVSRASTEVEGKGGVTGGAPSPAPARCHAGSSKGGYSRTGGGGEGAATVAPPSTTAATPFNSALVRFYDAFYER